MSRELPDFIASATAQFSGRVGLSLAQLDALTVLVRCAFESGFDRGRIDGAEAVAALSTPTVTKGGSS